MQLGESPEIDMNIFNNRSEEREKFHRPLKDAHWDVVHLIEKINKAIAIAGLREQSSDTRTKAEEYVSVLKELRNKSEDIMSLLSGFRNEVIRETGCDGSC